MVESVQKELRQFELRAAPFSAEGKMNVFGNDHPVSTPTSHVPWQ